MPEWLLFKKISWVTLLAFIAISVYGGLALLRKRTSNVVAQAIAVIWITGPVGLLIMDAVIPFLVFGKFDLTEAGFFWKHAWVNRWFEWMDGIFISIKASESHLLHSMIWHSCQFLLEEFGAG